MIDNYERKGGKRCGGKNWNKDLWHKIQDPGPDAAIRLCLCLMENTKQRISLSDRKRRNPKVQNGFLRCMFNPRFASSNAE